MDESNKENQIMKEAIYIERLQTRRLSMKFSESINRTQQTMKTRNESENTNSINCESIEGGDKAYGNRIKFIKSQLFQKIGSEEPSVKPSSPSSRTSSSAFFQLSPVYNKSILQASVNYKNNCERHVQNSISEDVRPGAKNNDDFPKVSNAHSVTADVFSSPIKNREPTTKCPFVEMPVPCSESEFHNRLQVIERRGPDEPRDPLFSTIQTNTLSRTSQDSLFTPIQTSTLTRNSRESTPTSQPDFITPNDTLSSSKSLPDLVLESEEGNALKVEQRQFLNGLLSSSSNLTHPVSEVTSPSYTFLEGESIISSNIRSDLINYSPNAVKEVNPATFYFVKPRLSAVNERKFDAFTVGSRQSGNEACLEKEFERNEDLSEQKDPSETFEFNFLEADYGAKRSKYSTRLGDRVDIKLVQPTIFEEVENYKSTDDNADDEESLSESYGSSLASNDFSDLDKEIRKLDESVGVSSAELETSTRKRAYILENGESENRKKGKICDPEGEEGGERAKPKDQDAARIRPSGVTFDRNKVSTIQRLSGLFENSKKMKKQTVDECQREPENPSKSQPSVPAVNVDVSIVQNNARGQSLADDSWPDPVISSKKQKKKEAEQSLLETTEPEELKNFLYIALGREHDITELENTEIYSSINETGFELSTRHVSNNYNNLNDNNNFTNNSSNGYVCIDRNIYNKDKNDTCQLIGDLILPVRKKSTQNPHKLKAFSESIKNLHKNSGPIVHLEPAIVEACYSDEKKVRILQEQTKIQESLVQQASKALAMCCSMPEFITSRERVESERALLLAQLRSWSYEQEIMRLKITQGNRTACPTAMDSTSNVVAEVTLKGIKLQMRDTVPRTDLPGGTSAEWFVIVIREGQRFWASESFLRSGGQRWINFPDHVSITNLKPDFKLTLHVYSMLLREQIDYEECERYHLPNNAEPKNTWFSPNEFIRDSLLRRSRKAAMQRARVNVAPSKCSLFRQVGEIVITARRLRSPLPWVLDKVPNSSSINGTIVANLECSNVKMNVLLEGLVNFGKGQEDNGIYWKAYYCVLRDYVLSFWNDPSDMTKKPEVFTIDLRHCITRTIHQAEKDVCIRKRTLVISVGRQRTSLDKEARHIKFCENNTVIVTHLLNFNDKEQCGLWQQKLNFVISNLYEWSKNIVYE